VNADAGMFPETVMDAGNPENAFAPTEVMDEDCIVIVFKAEQP